MHRESRIRHRVAGWASIGLLFAAGYASGANQTATLSPVTIGGSGAVSLSLGAPIAFPTDSVPTLHSFARAEYFDPAIGRTQWLVVGGMTNGMHDLTGNTGFEPAAHNTSAYVIDPVTRQVWSRSLEGAAAGLTEAQLRSLATANAQSSHSSSHLYIAGGYGPSFLPNGDVEYSTFDKLSSINLPGMVDWVKTGTGSAASHLRQITDPIFQVTGGDMRTTPSTGRTHLVFGQNYPSAYEPRLNGIYTNQVRSFTIVDDGTSLSVSNVVAHDPQPDFRRRDLNVVPTMRIENGVMVDGLQALAGVFTQSFGVWTVPVDIDANGNATQADPNAPGTLKQGMNSYRSATIGLFSESSGSMHTLLLGGISYQYYDPISGTFLEDLQIPFTGDITELVTTADGVMTQHLLPTQFPEIIAANTGLPYLLGAEAEFFLADGVPTYANGVINLDALTGPTLVGWIYGGIAAEVPNRGPTYASNAVFPVILTPVPEPASAMWLLICVAARRSRRT